VLDGVVYEHFLGFEMLDPTNGTLIPALFEEARQLLLNATALNKTVLVKAWPGPVTTPILPLGPSWPGNTQPNTYQGRADAALQWLDPALAAFLIVAGNNTWFSYSWWYTFPDGYAPCPDAPDTCSTPAGWYPQLAIPLGEPAGPGARVPGGSGWLYARTFAHADVVFDAANVTNSQITWH
jgi:hypothetical protein